MGLIVEVPAHLSWSQANNLVGSYCPAAYFYSRVLGKPEVPSWASIGGSAMHKATEDWDMNLMLEGISDNDPGYLGELFEAALAAEIAEHEEHSPFPREEWRASGRRSKEWPDKETEAWWHHHGPLFVHAWTAWRLTSPWDIAWILDADGNLLPGIEIPFVVDLGGGPVRGFIDRILTQQVNGVVDYMVLDLKSSQQEPKTAGQLATYKHGLLDQYGLDVRWGVYWMGRTGLSGTLADMNEWPRERVEFIYTESRATQLRGGFIHRPSNMCGSCSVRQFCAEFGGDKAAGTPQPWEVTDVIIKQAVSADSYTGSTVNTEKGEAE